MNNQSTDTIFYGVNSLRHLGLTPIYKCFNYFKFLVLYIIDINFVARFSYLFVYTSLIYIYIYIDFRHEV